MSVFLFLILITFTVYGSAGFSVVSIIVFIILFVVLSWIMVSFGIYKRRKRLRKQRLATTVLRYLSCYIVWYEYSRTSLIRIEPDQTPN